MPCQRRELAILILFSVTFHFPVSILVNGAYSDWSGWSNCDQSCGTGHKLRMRSCSSPEPKYGGVNCSTLGPDYDFVACNTDPCPGKTKQYILSFTFILS